MSPFYMRKWIPREGRCLVAHSDNVSKGRMELETSSASARAGAQSRPRSAVPGLTPGRARVLRGWGGRGRKADGWGTLPRRPTRYPAAGLITRASTLGPAGQLRSARREGLSAREPRWRAAGLGSALGRPLRAGHHRLPVSGRCQRLSLAELPGSGPPPRSSASPASAAGADPARPPRAHTAFSVCETPDAAGECLHPMHGGDWQSAALHFITPPNPCSHLTFNV